MQPFAVYSCEDIPLMYSVRNMQLPVQSNINPMPVLTFRLIDIRIGLSSLQIVLLFNGSSPGAASTLSSDRWGLHIVNTAANTVSARPPTCTTAPLESGERKHLGQCQLPTVVFGPSWNPWVQKQVLAVFPSFCLKKKNKKNNRRFTSPRRRCGTQEWSRAFHRHGLC